MLLVRDSSDLGGRYTTHNSIFSSPYFDRTNTCLMSKSIMRSTTSIEFLTVIRVPPALLKLVVCDDLS